MTPPSPSHVLFLDGHQTRRGPGHWQGLHAEILVSEGVRVDYPFLPTPDLPDLMSWATLILPMVGENTVVVALGLAASAWLRTAELGSPRCRAERALLVAPSAPMSDELLSDGPLLADVESVRALTRESSLLVVAADDPDSGSATRAWSASLVPRMVVLPTGGRLDERAGLGHWSAALTWIRSGEWPAGGGDASRHASIVVNAESIEVAAAAVQRLHRPSGPRQGIALHSSAPHAVAVSAVEALVRAGATAERRLATLHPRAGETLTRAEDLAYFVRRFGHEYTVVVADPAMSQAERAAIESACRAEGCSLVVLPDLVSPAASVSAGPSLREG